MEQLTTESKVVRNPDLLSAEIGAEVVLLDVERSAYFDTDAIGAEIWRRLAEPQTVEEICQALCERYDVSPDVCRADVLAFLQDARDEGLIQVAA